MKPRSGNGPGSAPPTQNLAATQAQARFNEGLALHHRGQLAQAQELYRQVLGLQPNHFDALHLLGVIAGQVGSPGQAVEWLYKAIEANPANALAYNNQGKALNDLNQHQAAIDSCDKAIAIKPNYANAHNNRGIALNGLKQHQAAIASYDKAIAIKPDFAEAHNNRGIALNDSKQYQAAIASYDRAIALKADLEFLFGTRLYVKMSICDWSSAGNQIPELVQKIQRNEKASIPFPVLSLIDSLPLQSKAAEIFVKNKHPANYELGDIPKRTRRDKIRLGYFSADFHNHATAYLMAELFERHGRDKFELVAFSFGPDANDEMRQRVAAAFDKFVDVRNQSDKEVAILARSLEIDIAIDLKGFTRDNRCGIFSYRAAPIQINYLGYPGTMGADYIDYLIADKTLIPESSKRHYSEQIAYLPNSYQVNDSRRKIADKVFTREELGLPESGFVFCCFNSNYKIAPGTFDGWMRILKRVNTSVLWLVESNPVAASNLRKEAQHRGVNPERLVFARPMPLPEHLARHRAADLFIDTLPCNAHTTASDALWAGLPVLTRTGDTFASRVAASLLTAIDLPELITSTQDGYESLAVELAMNPEQLKGIRQKLGRNRLSTPLFDTGLFTRHIEDAYAQMVERYQADLLPAHIYVTQ